MKSKICFEFSCADDIDMALYDLLIEEIDKYTGAYFYKDMCYVDCLERVRDIKSWLKIQCFLADLSSSMQGNLMSYIDVCVDKIVFGKVGL